MKKESYRLIIAFFTAFSLGTSAQTAFNDTTGDHLWTNAANWSAGVPDAADAVTQISNGGTLLNLDSDAGTVASFKNGNNSTSTLNIVTGGSLASGNFEAGNAGSTGVGIVNVDGGSLSVGGYLSLGRFGNARRGIATLNSGSITVDGETQLGGFNLGTGQLNVNGGTYTANSTLRVGLAGDGELNLGGGTINANANFTIGSGTGAGTAYLDSGTVTVQGATTIGNAANGTGALTLNGATFNATGQMKVGDAGAGTMNMNSGILTTSDSLGVAAGAGAGTMVMNAGTLSLTNIWGPGTLSIGGGTGEGLFELNGGKISIDSLAINNDGAGNARMEVNGGLLEIRNQWGNSLSITNNNAEFFVGEGVVTRAGNSMNGFTEAIDAGYITWDSSSTTMLTENWEVSYTNGTGSILYVDYNDATAGSTTMWAVIPEPATLGLVAAMGGVLLFVRRVFSL